MKFFNPYQFIPIDTRDTKTIKWKKPEDLKTFDNRYLRHDYWHQDAYSGRITCRLECLSPLVVGGEQLEGSKEKPGVVKPYRHPNGTVAIPGNSLRGMIASLTEIISQSSLRVLASEKDAAYSQRKQPYQSLKKIGLLLKEGDKYSIYPLANPLRVADYKTPTDPDTRFIRDRSTYQHQKNPQFVQADIISRVNECDIAKSLRQGSGKAGTPGILYIRGKHDNMPNKRREAFIPWNGKRDQETIPVDQEVVIRLGNMIRLRYYSDSTFPHLPQGYDRQWDKEEVEIVEDGDLLYYRVASNGEVDELSYSSIWRRPVQGSLYDALENSGGENVLPWNNKRQTPTPAEWLFGVTEEKPDKDKAARNIASRLRFSDAAPDDVFRLDSPVPLKILASPKPPSPSMYFTDAQGQYIAKKNLDLNNAVPNGRKYYVSFKDKQNTWQRNIKEQDYNWKPHLSCQPIPEKTTFTFFIFFENLSNEELGLLRTALRPSENFIHRLGLGKPLGLGHVSVDITKIECIDRINRYSPQSLKCPLPYRQIDQTQSPDKTLVDRDALNLLLKLSLPDNQQPPICYPFASDFRQKPYNERKGFKWFVENDGLTKGNDWLKKITLGQPLPTLESSHPRIELTYLGTQKINPADVKIAMEKLSCDIKVQHVSLSDGQITIYLESNEDISKFQSCSDQSTLELKGIPCKANSFPRI